ncbi:MAG: hypothetical protein WCD21_15860, partial [Streptomyces sp.]
MNYANSNSSQTPEARQGHGHRDVAGAQRRRRFRTYGIGVAVVLTATTASAGYLAMAEPPSGGAAPDTVPQVHGSSVDFILRGGTARVDTTSLRVTGHAAGGASL